MTKVIVKASGQEEVFDRKKFAHSLKRVGVDDNTIALLSEEIEKIPSLKTTKDIYAYAYNQLFLLKPRSAIRYNLKHALYELGPIGFPFEQYVAEVFKHQGHAAKTNQIIKGQCVDHEIDVIIIKDDKRAIIECKFRNIQGQHLNIKVPLYVKARFEDIRLASHNHYDELWIITNTQFTDSARAYAKCAHINLLGWGYPKHNGLEVIIDTLRLHPITILKSLNHEEKKALINANLLLCRDVRNKRDILFKLGLSENQINKINIECELLYNHNSAIHIPIRDH